MPMFTKARDYKTVQEALDATSYGGRCYFEAKEYDPFIPPDQNGWVIDKPIEIYGDGHVNESAGFQYFNAGGERKTSDSTIFQLKTGGNHFYLHDICISGPVDRLPGTGDGIRFNQPGAVIWACVLERVGILYAGRHGIAAFSPDGPDGTTGYFVAPSFKDVNVYGSKSHGIYFRNTTAVSMVKVTPTQSGGSGFYCHSVNGSFDGCTAESNGLTQSGPQEASNMYIEDSAAVSITGWHFEDFGYDVAKTALVMNNCRGFNIAGNLFEAPGERGLLMKNCRGNTIGSNAHFGLKTTIEMDADCTGNVIFPQNHEAWGVNQGNMIIPRGKNIVYPMVAPNDNKAAGMSFPEINSTSEVKNPRNGMVIYDVKAGRLKYFHGGSWRTLRTN